MSPERLPRPPYNPRLRQLVADKRSWSRTLGEEDIERGFRGWYEDGCLPHRDEPGLTQFVTFRLADSFPEELRSEWGALLCIEDDRKRRFEFETYLDKGRGRCWLRRPELAAMVQEALLFRHGIQYEMLAWVVMPNHVHVLFVEQDVPMSQVVDAWKGFTAKEANKILKRRGTFWQKRYWDTYMRDKEHELKARQYIENNPTKARLAVFARDWTWSSSRFRDNYQRLCLPTQGACPSPGTAIQEDPTQ